MLLRRLGNKSKLAKKIQTYFPAHTLYIEPFFGAGGMYFNKPKAKYNILNDLDSEVFNLFQVVSHQSDELHKEFKKMPICEDLWNHWKTNEETDPIRKAIRFLFTSNYGFMGLPDTLRFGGGNTTQIILDNIHTTNQLIFGCEFMNADFRKVFKKISFKSDKDRSHAFCYCDPPYLETANNYEAGFTFQDSIDLFDTLEQSGIKWAMSEFNHPFILKQATDRNLFIHEIGERRNLGNRRVEVLITNFEKMQLNLF